MLKYLDVLYEKSYFSHGLRQWRIMGLESAICVPELLPSPCVWVQPAQPAEQAIICLNPLAKAEFVQKRRANLPSWGEAELDTTTVQGRDGSTALNVQGVNKCGLLHVFAETDKQLEEAEI